MNAIVEAPKKSHLFQKGQSGNAAGRPKGAKNAISILKIQVEGELRARSKERMAAVVEEMFRQALPTAVLAEDGSQKLDAAGAPLWRPGDRDMLKTLYTSWVSKTRASDEEPERERIQIVIGKLDQVPPISGRVINEEKE